jgi:hypothetical protein
MRVNIQEVAMHEARLSEDDGVLASQPHAPEAAIQERSGRGRVRQVQPWDEAHQRSRRLPPHLHQRPQARTPVSPTLSARKVVRASGSDRPGADAAARCEEWHAM